MDDLIPLTIACPIDGEADIVLSSCGEAIQILDEKDSRGRKLASDGLRKLAKHFFTATLNDSAGAFLCGDVDAHYIRAQELLCKYQFSAAATGVYLRPQDGQDYDDAIEAARWLDAFNNNCPFACGDTEGCAEIFNWPF